MLSLQEFYQYLKESKFKLTSQRCLIVKHLLAIKGTIDAKTLLKSVRLEQKNVSMDTVYRTLASLCRLGMLYKIEKAGQGNEYEVIGGRHVHYLICLHCGKRASFANCPLQLEGISEIGEKGFHITGHKFELYGFCESCSNKGDKNEKIY